MSTITTASRWIRLPTAGGGSDRARLDQPADGALMQVLASNATLACRENGLRTLWERGPAEVYADTPINSDDPTYIPWDTGGHTGWSGGLIEFAGTHRVRFWGETSDVPRIVLATRGSVSNALYSLGVALFVIPGTGYPGPSTGYTADRTTSTTTVDLTAIVPLVGGHLAAGARNESPSPGVTPTVPAVEFGRDAEVSLYVAAWCTSNSGANKAQLGGLTIYLEEP